MTLHALCGSHIKGPLAWTLVFLQLLFLLFLSQSALGNFPYCRSLAIPLQKPLSILIVDMTGDGSKAHVTLDQYCIGTWN